MQTKQDLKGYNNKPIDGKKTEDAENALGKVGHSGVNLLNPLPYCWSLITKSTSTALQYLSKGTAVVKKNLISLKAYLIDNVMEPKKSKIKWHTGLYTINAGLLGYFFKKVYFINPNPSGSTQQKDYLYNIAPLLNELDKERDSRQLYGHFDDISGSSQAFAHNGPESLIVRNHLAKYLKDRENIFTICLAATSSVFHKYQSQKIITSDFVREIVLTVLVQKFFHLTKLPNEVNECVAQMENDFKKNVTIFPRFFSPINNAAKNNYSKLYGILITSQLDIISNLLNRESEVKLGEHLLIDLLLEIIGERYENLVSHTAKINFLKSLTTHDLQDHLNHAYIKSAIGFLIASDNIVLTITECLNTLYKTSESKVHNYKSTHEDGLIIQKLLIEQITENGFNFDKFSALNQNCSELNNCYHYFLTKAMYDHDKIFRYTKKPISIKDSFDDSFTFKANSILVFELGHGMLKFNDFVYFRKNHPGIAKEKSLVFSSKNHARGCPGSIMAEVLFKTIISKVVTSEEYTFINPDNKYLEIEPRQKNKPKSLAGNRKTRNDFDQDISIARNKNLLLMTNNMPRSKGSTNLIELESNNSNSYHG